MKMKVHPFPASIGSFRPQWLAFGIFRALQSATGSLMLGPGEGAAIWAERLKTSKLALFDSKLALSKAKLDRLDLLLLASDARLSLLLRFKDAAVGEEMPVTLECPSLSSVAAINVMCESRHKLTRKEECPVSRLGITGIRIWPSPQISYTCIQVA